MSSKGYKPNIFDMCVFLWFPQGENKKKYNNNNNNNNYYYYLLHLYSAFLGTQSALHERGESPQPPPMCDIHL